ncbi:hypothetical protein HG531_006020 [Fusarium graminearum]|nr:hypothetical protein HG531_006020 [Fusarium graminearum]
MPSEVGNDMELNAQDISVEGCNFSLNVNCREVVKNLCDVLASTLVMDQASDLGRLHVLHCLDGQVFLGIELVENRFGKVELMKRMLVRPDALFNRFCQGQKHKALVAPSTVEGKHKECSTDTSRLLSYVVHVVGKSKVFRLGLGDVGLEENICLCLRSIDTSIDITGNNFSSQMSQLLLFAVSGLNVVKLSTHADHLQDVCFSSLGLHHSIEHLNACMKDVILTGDSSNVLAAKFFCPLIIYDHLALLQSFGGLDGKLAASLNQVWVVSDF